MTAPHRLNNFDLIRLLAAAQVVAAHAIGHTDLQNQLPEWGRAVFEALMMIPGVPIFFVISGFLITKSHEKNPTDLTAYFWRRGLRIFPALWVCLFFTLVALGSFGFLGVDFMLSKTFIAWLAGQVSFFQFYNPEHFRGFGIGVANGALWTITVELQFYLFVPILYALTRNHQASSVLMPLLFFVSFGAYCIMDDKVNGPGGFTGAPILFKLLHVTLVPHLWMFMLGIFIHREFKWFQPWIEGRFIHYMAAFALFMTLQCLLIEDRSVPFYLAYLPSRILLALATIAGAYSCRSVSLHLLRGNDVSYGIYIYHSIVINIMVQLGLMTSMLSVAGVYAVSAALALLSWHCVEKPALACKSISPRSFWNRLTGSAGSGT